MDEMNKVDGRISDDLDSTTLKLHCSSFPVSTHEIWRHYTDDPAIESYKQDTGRLEEEYITGEQCTSIETRPSDGLEKKEENHIGTVKLFGVDIVCLFVDGKERLCLAQISNTLLKDFSYNEIHNRRVALGITCIQCTPVQLEILRRTGAMPISSRRCGLITKREADRLVKSFLDEITPPQFPEGFAFKVYHKCGWGCKGLFYPSRYNSSRAKCIKCVYCQGYFSPNKFIFHYHKTNSTTYKHPDAANFNSWRRHLELCDSKDNESLEHAWEDVKAMFNGGCRKRVYCSGAKTSVCTSNKDELWSSDRYQKQESNVPVVIPNHETPHYIEPTIHPAFPKPCLNGFHSYGEYLRALSLPYMSAWCGAPGYKPQNMMDASEFGMTLPVNMFMYHNYTGSMRGDKMNYINDDSKAKSHLSLIPGQSRPRSKNKTETVPGFLGSREQKTTVSRLDAQTKDAGLKHILEDKDDDLSEQKTSRSDVYHRESPAVRNIDTAVDRETVNRTMTLENEASSNKDSERESTVDSTIGEINLADSDNDVSLYSEDKLRELLDRIKQQKTNMKRKIEGFHSPDSL